jgi:hypothetical protein
MAGRVRGPAVRAENPVHGSDQQSCPACRPAVMITDHVPAVRLPPDHARGLMAAVLPARGDLEDRRDLDLAPPARRPATGAPVAPEAELGGPALLTTLLGVIPKAQRQGLRLLVTPDTIVRWHRDIVRRRWAARSVPGKSGRPATRRNIRAMVLRLARENPEWDTAVMPSAGLCRVAGLGSGFALFGWFRRAGALGIITVVPGTPAACRVPGIGPVLCAAGSCGRGLVL